jgi:biofilm PGA synthesis N-glycosyltransferase PgaC
MMILFYITLVLLLGYGVLINFYDRWWSGIPDFDQDTIPGASPGIGITVIIPARNEEKNIGACLSSLCRQDYPPGLLEIIVVNDFSSDKTVDIVKQFTQGNIKLIHLGDHVGKNDINSYKKKAIEIAISQAKGDLIITTDADCIAGNQWVKTIANFQNKHNAVLIAAPVKMEPDKSLLSIFQSLDFLTLQGITAAAVQERKHSMCNGANLAYLKTAYYAVDGFNGIDKMASGDDMLLMHKIAQKFPDQYFFLKNKNAIVSTKPEKTWSDFLQQRIRWASKADKYDDKRIFYVLLLVYLLNVCIAVFLVAGCWNYKHWIQFLLLVTGKIAFEYPFVKKIASFFDQQKIVKWLSLLQPLHIFYTIIAGLLGKFSGYEWKGRKVK